MKLHFETYRLKFNKNGTVILNESCGRKVVWTNHNQRLLKFIVCQFAYRDHILFQEKLSPYFFSLLIVHFLVPELFESLKQTPLLQIKRGFLSVFVSLSNFLSSLSIPSSISFYPFLLYFLSLSHSLFSSFLFLKTIASCRFPLLRTPIKASIACANDATKYGLFSFFVLYDISLIIMARQTPRQSLTHSSVSEMTPRVRRS